MRRVFIEKAHFNWFQLLFAVGTLRWAILVQTTLCIQFLGLFIVSISTVNLLFVRRVILLGRLFL